MKIVAVDGAIVVNISWYVEGLNLLAMRITDDISDLSVVVLCSILRVPHDFVDEIAEMQNEAKPILVAGLFIFIDHSAVCILRAEIRVLAAYEGKSNRPWVVVRGCCDGSTHATARTVLIRKAVPINLRGL